jgi:tRNA(fMet)-specific endonuclease VapC
MSLLLLDTTFLIDGQRNVDGPETVIADDDDVAIAAVTVAELRAGAIAATTRVRQRRHDYVDALLAALPVLPYDVDVALVHAELLTEVRRAGRPRGAHDLIIAATARAYRRTVVSADRRAFEGLTGVQAIDNR